jgi:hypothetical protein
VFVFRKNVAASAVLVAVCFCIALNCYCGLARNSSGQTLFEQLKDPEASFHALTNIDRLYAGLPPGENAFVIFKNFEPDNEALVERVYYRSNYAAYPNKVFAVAPGTVVNRGRDILKSSEKLDDEWLDQHRISRLIEYEQKPDGRITAVATARQLP